MRKYRRLTRADRYQIERFLARGKSVQWIADELGFHRSTVYRELQRGALSQANRDGRQKGEYSALAAHRKAASVFYDRYITFEYRGKKIRGWVHDQVVMKLESGWSPEQISGRLWHEHSIRISAESIYKFIYSYQKRGVNLHRCLRHYGRRRKRSQERRNRYWELQYRRRKSIEDRPAEASTRQVPGHWERDLMLGKRGTGAILASVERSNQYLLLAKVDATSAEEVNQASYQALKRSKLPCYSITNDNGHEFGEFWKLEEKTKAPVYFTHPLCPWERGSVENVIGLLRQYIPKGTNLNTIDESWLKALERHMNRRPRKSLGYRTPEEVAKSKTRKLITKQKFRPLTVGQYEALVNEDWNGTL